MSQQRNLKGILDSIVDDDGIKTEVTVTMSDATLIKTSAYIIGATMLSSIGFFIIRGIFQNLQSS